MHTGNSQAGPANEEAIANIEELEKPSTNKLPIPNVSPEMDSFLLQVKGESMIAMGILPGDYVIVEKQESLWRPDPQDLIVTYYLPHDPTRKHQDCRPSDDEYVGPVIKVYRPGTGKVRHELGWIKRNAQNPHLIKADDIKPIGKVVGSYRDYQSSIPKGFNI